MPAAWCYPDKISNYFSSLLLVSDILQIKSLPFQSRFKFKNRKFLDLEELKEGPTALAVPSLIY